MSALFGVVGRIAVDEEEEDEEEDDAFDVTTMDTFSNYFFGSF